MYLFLKDYVEENLTQYLFTHSIKTNSIVQFLEFHFLFN